MRFARWVSLTLAVAAGLFASTRWTLRAQDRPGKGQARARVEAAAPRPAGVSVQDALLRPLDLPFGDETTLEEVRRFLADALGAQVVLDRAALDRLELTPEDTVQLDLKGVRLKVGLRLVLDQVGLSYRVEAEDNLLILTDPGSGADPASRVIAELKALHRDLHDLQDSVDDLRALVEEDLGVEPEPARHHSSVVGFGRGRPSRRPASAGPDRRPAPRRSVGARG